MTTPRTDITRKGRWAVVGDGLVSQHNTDIEAVEAAVNWSAANGGRTARIDPPYYDVRVLVDSIEPTPPVDPPVIDPEPVDPPEPPVVTPPVEAGELTPGDGWDGPTAQPGQIGTAHEIAIAQWNVVPERQITGGFELGVVAHHIEGIDHVMIGVDGGPWLKVSEASINPRTGSEEYWATLNTTGQTGWKEVRAIAVPTSGKPRVLPSIRLYAGENSELFPEIVLQAGTYDAGELVGRFGVHTKGWATIRAADGVSNDQVVITGNVNTRDRHIRFEGITRKLGQWDEHYGNLSPESWWWFDNSRIIGNKLSRWIVHHSARQYYTKAYITDMQVAFQGANLLARDVVIERGWEDICRSYGMMVNVTVKRLDRGEFTNYHPDLFQWFQADMDNFIAQDVSSPNNVGQGLFPGDIKNSAFVRMDITTTGNYRALQMQGKTRNVLIKDCRFNGPGNLRNDKGFLIPDGERLVFDGTTVGGGDPPLPAGWQQDGVEIR